MERVEVELLSHGGNNAVVHMPGRRFPGVLVQGDSLSILLSMAETVENHLTQGNTAEAKDEADLADSLAEMLEAYEAALAAHNIGRPYGQTFRRRWSDK